MNTIDEVFGNAELLHANDLPAGRSVPVVIASVEARKFSDGAKLIVRFVGKQKKLCCNKTNAHAIAAELGTRRYSEWVGKQISLIRAMTDFRGEQVPCVRVQRTTTPPSEPTKELQLDRTYSQVDSF